MIKDDVLACPNCSPVQAEGNDYLHHFAMTVYRRSQEDDPTEVQNIDDIAPCHEREPDAGLHPNPSNPSLRRDGIRIWFDCELCGQISCLCIAQHKGQTFIYMESKEEIQKLEGQNLTG